MYQVANALQTLHHALPQTCTLCSAPAGIALVCDDCAGSLDRLANQCPRCALPMDNESTCRRCRAGSPAFDATVAPYAYTFPLDRLIQAFKYHGTLSLAGWFADRMLALRAMPPAADMIVAMPLAPKRQRERGFNHALEIARSLSRKTRIPVDPHAVKRRRETPAQATLPWSKRANNVRDAFGCAARLDGRSVIVVDDVMTTGASLDELARTLKAAGATRVENWLVARTLPPRD